MAKKSLDSGLANLFGSTKTTEFKAEANTVINDEPTAETAVQPEKTVPTEFIPSKIERAGKPKVLPENFVRTNYIMDPEIIRKFKAIATLRGTSVNLLANEVIGNYVSEHFENDTSR